MKFLLDTHVALWAVANNPRLSDTAKSDIATPENHIAVSVASLWEIAIKHASENGRARMPVSPTQARDAFMEAGFEILPIDANHALGLADLPPIHKDPFDRLLVAQARAEGMMLLTSDAAIAQYPGDVRLV